MADIISFPNQINPKPIETNPRDRDGGVAPATTVQLFTICTNCWGRGCEVFGKDVDCCQQCNGVGFEPIDETTAATFADKIRDTLLKNRTPVDIPGDAHRAIVDLLLDQFK